MQSKAATVEEYLASLPEERRDALKKLRKVMREAMDSRYEERMSYGMIGYAIPHAIYPAGYHCDPKMPLPFAGMASQKNHMSLYLMCVYFDADGSCGDASKMGEWFRQAWAKTGKKLDMGKSCIRFKRIEDLALDVIAETLRRAPVETYIAWYEAALEKNQSARKSPPPKKSAKAAAKKAPAKKAAKKAPATGRTAKPASKAAPPKKAMAAKKKK